MIWLIPNLIQQRLAHFMVHDRFGNIVYSQYINSSQNVRLPFLTLLGFWSRKLAPQIILYNEIFHLQQRSSKLDLAFRFYDWKSPEKSLCHLWHHTPPLGANQWLTESSASVLPRNDDFASASVKNWGTIPRPRQNLKI